MDADEARMVFEALLSGDTSVYRYLWISYADPAVCPVEPRPWLERPDGTADSARDEVLALMIETMRW